MTSVPIVVCLLALATAQASEPLRFNPPVVEIRPTIDETSVSFPVQATNASPRTIDITEFRGGCGCITFTSPKRTLEPGASADVLVVFDFKDYVGAQKRTLSIMTTSADDPQPVKSGFQLVGTIPTAISFTKKAAIWLYGEPATAKEITVTANPEYVISELRVEDPKVNHFIGIEQTLSDDGRQLRVRVAPTTTSIEDVSPTARANLQVPYVVKYKTQKGTARYERFWALLVKRPEIKGAEGTEAKSPTPEQPRP